MRYSLFILVLSLLSFAANGQNNALVLNGAYVKVNGGSFASPVYLVVNAGQATGIMRTSGHIISEAEGNYVQWNTSDVTVTSNYVFPMGYSNTDYLPVTIHKNSVGSGSGHTNNASAIVMSTWATAAANNLPFANTVTAISGPSGAGATNSVIDRWWQVQAGTNVSATADVSYRGAENTTAAPLGLFSGQHWDIPSLQWAPPTGSGTGLVSGIGTVSNITLVNVGAGISSPYILSSASLPLPIELVSFTAVCENGEMNIKWANASETNVMNIELQKSYDLNNWTTIHTAAPSNTSTMTYYNYNYGESMGGQIYYRLRTNNNDGYSDLSAVIYAQSCGSAENTLSSFYAEQSIYVHTHFLNGTSVNYIMYDLQGKKILQGSFSASEGDQLTTVQTADLSNGIYIFSATADSKTYTQKILITNK
jgi:hypothetical protein